LTLKVLSLFSGIGSFEKSLTNLNIDYKLVGFSEIDKYAIGSYKAMHNVPDKLNYGDISKVNKSNLPEFDLLVGGSPCQSFSTAGRRKGFEDTRGTLFFEFAKTLKLKQPRYFLYENVKGVVNHDKGNTLDTMVQALSDIGYTIDFNVLNSKYFDVPQNRERIYIVGLLNYIEEKWVISKKKNIVDKGKLRLMENVKDIKTFNYDWPKQNNINKKLKHVLEDKVDEKYYLSDEKTKKLINRIDKKYLLTDDKVPGWIPKPSEVNRTLRTGGKSSLSSKHNYDYIAEEQNDDKFLIDDQGRTTKRLRPLDISPTIRREMHGNEPRVVESISSNTDVKSCSTRTRSYIGQSERLEIRGDEVSNTITSVPKDSYVLRHELESDIQDIIKKTRPNEKMSIKFKDNGDIRPHRNDIKKSGISELNINLDENQSFTVTASHMPKVYGNTTSYRIRKLTPLECFRLQAFSDEDFQRCKDYGISDSQIYKQAGNSITVTVLEEIFKNLLKYQF